MLHSKPIYLDYNATCPLATEVVAAMHDALVTLWANPSSDSQKGRLAKDAIESARECVAIMVGGIAKEIIFTSGGTEANNWVILAAIENYRRCIQYKQGQQHPHVITSNIEHDSIKCLLEHLQRSGDIDVTFVQVSKSGAIVPDDVMTAIRPTTCLITVMLANNETGVLQPIDKISQLLEERNKNSYYKILFHSDAAQVIGKLPVDVKSLGVDFLTIVGHKFYGPRNGALWVKQDILANNVLRPIMFGGGQERGLRSGSENTPAIVGLGKACYLVSNCIQHLPHQLRKLRDYFEKSLQDRLGADCARINFADADRLPNTSSVCFANLIGPANQMLSCLCDEFSASTGAACHTGVEASPILLSCGLSEHDASRTVRFSLGKYTTKIELDSVVLALQEFVSASAASQPHRCDDTSVNGCCSNCADGGLLWKQFKSKQENLTKSN